MTLKKYAFYFIINSMVCLTCLFQRSLRLYFNYKTLKHYRSRSKYLIRDAHNYITKVQSFITIDAKKFWGYVQAKKNISGIPGTMKYSDMSDIELSKPSVIVNIFGDYFNSVFIDCSPASVLQLSEKSIHPGSHIMVTCIKIEDVRVSLRHFKNLWRHNIK